MTLPQVSTLHSTVQQRNMFCYEFLFSQNTACCDTFDNFKVVTTVFHGIYPNSLLFFWTNNSCDISVSSFCYLSVWWDKCKIIWLVLTFLFIFCSAFNNCLGRVTFSSRQSPEILHYVQQEKNKNKNKIRIYIVTTTDKICQWLTTMC